MSLSLMPGMMGEMEMPVSTPASERAAIVSKRCDGSATFGSISRAVASSAKAIET